jgi:hypothetical protein
MTGGNRLLHPLRYSAVVTLCAIVVAAVFQLFVMDSGSLALVVLALGSLAWGVASGALRARGLALPAIAFIVEWVVAFEFKRIYMLDYVAGPVQRSVGVFVESIFLSDLLIVAIVTGLGWLGWQFQRRMSAAGV